MCEPPPGEQDSMLAVNLYSVLHSPSMWKDPESFVPERHLDADGKLVKTEGFYPFGTGESAECGTEKMDCLSV